MSNHPEQQLTENTAILVGLSPSNSYFKKDTIERLVRKATTMADTYVFIPDLLMEHTYRALGHEDPKGKAKRKGQQLRSQVRQALEGIDATIYIWERKESVPESWINVNDIPQYKEHYNNILELYDKNDDFRRDIRETTAQVLLNHDVEPTEERLDEGAQYLLKEFGFITALPAIVGKLVVNTYHQPFPIMEQYIAGKYGTHTNNLGFMVMDEK